MRIVGFEKSFWWHEELIRVRPWSSQSCWSRFVRSFCWCGVYSVRCRLCWSNSSSEQMIQNSGAGKTQEMSPNQNFNCAEKRCHCCLGQLSLTRGKNASKTLVVAAPAMNQHRRKQKRFHHHYQIFLCEPARSRCIDKNSKIVSQLNFKLFLKALSFWKLSFSF